MSACNNKQQEITKIYYQDRIKNDQYDKELQGWLNNPDHIGFHKVSLESYQAGTGVWFLEGPEFGKWKSDPASSLWIYGIGRCHPRELIQC